MARVELDPSQPDEVERVVAALVSGVEPSEPSPWWRAGIEEALTDADDASRG